MFTAGSQFLKHHEVLFTLHPTEFVLACTALLLLSSKINLSRSILAMYYCCHLWYSPCCECMYWCLMPPLWNLFCMNLYTVVYWSWKYFQTCSLGVQSVCNRRRLFLYHIHCYSHVSCRKPIYVRSLEWNTTSCEPRKAQETETESARGKWRNAKIWILGHHRQSCYYCCSTTLCKHVKKWCYCALMLHYESVEMC